MQKKYEYEFKILQKGYHRREYFPIGSHTPFATCGSLFCVYIHSMTYQEKLKDPRWQKKRLEIFNRDGFSCWWCGDKETTLHLHHEAYIGKDPWDAPDYCLITLCEECHEVEHYPLTGLEKILIDTFRNSNMRDYDKIKLLNSVIKANREKNVKKAN